MRTDNYRKRFRLILTLTLCVWSCSKASKQNLRNDFEQSVEANEFGTINLDGRNDECKLHHIFRETAAGLSSRADLIKRSRASSDHIHEVIFAVQGNGLDDLTELLHDISDPNSESYGQHMTRDQIEQISSNSASRDIVITHLREVGAQIVSVSAYGEYITAQAPISVWEKSFDTEFYKFDHTHPIDSTPTQVIRAEKYSVPASLHEHLAYVFHTVQMPLAIWGNPIMHLLRNSSSNIFASVASGTVSPTLLNEFYNIKSNRGTTKSSQAVYETIGQNLSPKDLTRFQTYFGLPLEPVTTYIGGQVSDDLCIKSPESCTEANLDTQYLMAISQGSPTTHWYTDSNSFAAWLLTVAGYADPPRVISISYGASESTVTKSEFDAFNVQAIKLGLMGVTIVAASGDDGVLSHSARNQPQGCAYSPLFPASSPYVTAVGATQGPESGYSEVTCQRDLGGVITSGGGFSTYYLQPTWQSSAVQAYFRKVIGTVREPVAGYRAKGRGYPDISFLGTNYAVAIGGDWYSVSGTSASCPVFAGMVSLINGVRIASGKSSVGWINPALYYYKALYVNDIVSGRNNCDAGNLAKCCTQGFYATQGWDPATGLGSLNFEPFKRLIFSLGGVYKERTASPSASPTIRPTVKPTSKPASNMIPLGAHSTSTPTLISMQTGMSSGISIPTVKKKTKRSINPLIAVTRSPNLVNSNLQLPSQKSIRNRGKGKLNLVTNLHMTDVSADDNDIEEVEMDYLIV